MTFWYAVHTHSRSEEKALAHLARQGFSAYLPRFLKRRSHARCRDWVPAPLFPRYLFVALDLGRERWRAVRSTVGACDRVLVPALLRITEQPTVNEEEAQA